MLSRVGAALRTAVAGGMWAYSSAAFRVTVLGPRRLAARAGHADPRHAPAGDGRAAHLPAALAPGRALRAGRIAFAARDDMFLPGFFAGFPPELPAAARRALFRRRGRALAPARRGPSDPQRERRAARRGPARRSRESEPLPDPEAFAARARALGLPLPAPDRRRRARRVRRSPLAAGHAAPSPRARTRTGSGPPRGAGAARLPPARRASCAPDAARPLPRGTALARRRASARSSAGSRRSSGAAGRPRSCRSGSLRPARRAAGRASSSPSASPFPPDDDGGARRSSCSGATMPLTAGQLVAAGAEASRTRRRAGPVEPGLLDPEPRAGRGSPRRRRAAEREPGGAAVPSPRVRERPRALAGLARGLAAAEEPRERGPHEERRRGSSPAGR